MDYKKFRVRTPIRTFRDLEVYQQATRLSAEIFNLKLPAKYKRKKDVIEELETLKKLSKNIPKLMVQSYSDKFTNFNLADKKMELAAQTANMIVAKIDFLIALIESESFRETLNDILKRYQRLKRRTINLKRAWMRVFGNLQRKNPSKDSRRY